MPPVLSTVLVLLATAVLFGLGWLVIRRESRLRGGPMTQHQGRVDADRRPDPELVARAERRPQR